MNYLLSSYITIINLNTVLISPALFATPLNSIHKVTLCDPLTVRSS